MEGDGVKRVVKKKIVLRLQQAMRGTKYVVMELPSADAQFSRHVLFEELTLL